jgi:DNA-binding NtrC family response regulator
VDVRLLVTTDRDLEAEVQTSRFREDLFYRLRVVRVQVPRLGSRREDIPFLADAFRRQACFAHGRQVHATLPRRLADGVESVPPPSPEVPRAPQRKLLLERA